MTGKKQLVKISFPNTEIGGPVKHSIGITNPFRDGIENHTYPTIQPTNIHFNQKTRQGNSDWNQFNFKNLNIGIDFSRSRQNIDNRIGMNPQGTILTTIPDSNRANNCDILDLVIR